MHYICMHGMDHLPYVEEDSISDSDSADSEDGVASIRPEIVYLTPDLFRVTFHRLDWDSENGIGIDSEE
jgi:hypothetical protein